MKKLLLLIGIATAGYLGLAGDFLPHEAPRPGTANDRLAREPTGRSEQTLARAFENHTSDVQVEGRGVVTRILPDDSDGSAHQRFIIELVSGQTLLIAHNIDVAPRIVALDEGDPIGFKGEYEWNPQGGVIHWTHRDPQGRHADGWIVHDGRKYQ